LNKWLKLLFAKSLDEYDSKKLQIFVTKFKFFNQKVIQSILALIHRMAIGVFVLAKLTILLKNNKSALTLLKESDLQ